MCVGPHKQLSKENEIQKTDFVNTLGMEGAMFFKSYLSAKLELFKKLF